MQDPIGYFLTWVTYGTWLPGDARGWVEFQKGWQLHALNCRSNHVHVVVSAGDTIPTKIRSDLKAWATRCLKKQFDPTRENWWGERGSVRHLFDEDDLEAAVTYVVDGQDWKAGKRSR
jgi:REP element-mobilizing transposase RayT